MKKKHPISQADKDAFANAMQGVKRLIPSKIRLSTKTQKPLIIKKPNQTSTHHTFLNENATHSAVHSEEYISYRQNGISNKTLRKLQKGQYNVEASLDLHGLSSDAAKTAVEQFLVNCVNLRKRVVLIIHGKGHHSPAPILKNKINQWLRETRLVLAFCSAAKPHGNRGAIYVLLTRHQLGDLRGE